MKKYITALTVFLFAVLLILSVQNTGIFRVQEDSAAVIMAPKENKNLRVGIFMDLDKNIFQAGLIASGIQVVYQTPEEQAAGIYTFLQGPKAWTEGRAWSGEWCQMVVRRNSFGGFGCGLCCMANIYSSLSPYECSPVDMYEFATQISGYYPTKESGAIGWGDMKAVLTASGLTCELYGKPAAYEEFQQQMAISKSAVVLVSSQEDDTFWKDTPGHYVNIWLYEPKTDMVFLAEPGDPENNRTWIPLQHVYNALKTVSQYQYLAVTSYEEDKNQWKSNGIDDNWGGR